MTIRDAITQLLTGDNDGSVHQEPADVLAQNGYEDVPAELFGTALSHFSDTAPLEQADALAPIVTRLSPVPFEEQDLPELPGGLDADSTEGLDAYSLFQSAASGGVLVGAADQLASEPSDGGESDLDDVDNDADGVETIDADTDTDATSETDADADEGFGTGTAGLEASDAEDQIDDALLEDDVDLDALAPRFDAGAPANEAHNGLGGFSDPIEDEGADLFSVEFDESDQLDDGLDPNDLDFDLE